MFYVPLLPYAFYLALKSRSFGFFSAVNPGIEGSGNGLESKFKTIELLPPKYKPKSIFIPKNQSLKKIISDLNSTAVKFPLIIKPDIGFRGLLVKKINSEFELNNYLKKYNSINLIIQEFIDYKNECGIFYYRVPGEKEGVISSVTLKKYLTVLGDGKSTLLSLINASERAEKYLDLILEVNKEKLNSIPNNKEEIILNFIESIERPRKIIILVPSGNPNEEVISKLITVLNENDIIIDAGNTNPVVSFNNKLKTV